MDTPRRPPKFIMSSNNYFSSPNTPAPTTTPTATTTKMSQKKTTPSEQHDRMLQQAIYNTGANVFVIFAGLAVVLLYWVLESFFRPLMWAMLCGAFLYPFKSKLTRNIKSWLTGLKESGTPFALGVFKIPIDLLDISSENLIHSVYERWRVIAVVSGVIFTLYVTHYHAPMDFKQFSGFIVYLYEAVSNFISFFSFKWVCGLIIGYFIAVVKLWSPENKTILSYLSIPIWLLTMFCLIANAGALRLPLAVIIIVLMAVGYYTDRNGHHEQEEHTACNNDGEKVSAHSLGDLSFKEGFNKFTSILRTSLQYSQAIEEEPICVDNNNEVEEDSQVLASEGVDKESGEEPGSFASSSSADSELLEPTGVVDITPIVQDSHYSPATPDVSPQCSTTPATPSTGVNSQISLDAEKGKKRRRSDRCFIFLFWAIILVLLWSNVWLLFIPFISIAYRLVKMLVKWVWLTSHSYREKLLRGEEMEPIRVWCLQRLDVVVPAPIKGMTQFMLKGDKKVINVLLGSADAIITILLIVLLLVGFVSLSVAVSYQVQKEGIHLVTVTSNLVQNRTNELQWITGVLKEGGTNETGGIHASLDPMIKNLYIYGREWIVSQIAERISHEPSRLLLQSEATSAWDSLYESWVTKNATAIPKPNYDGALFSHIRNGGVELMWESISLDMSGFLAFMRENIGIFQSVIESVWILLKGNLNLAFSLLISLLQIILGGGSAILNSFLSSIVFFTTLFYLLASSSTGYKPVELISGLTFARTGNKFAQAVEDGIGGVFAASLKMAAFYGFYTWLTHTVFGINIVFLPSVFAAILGAIPFIGTYWAALPAIMELSLVHKEVFLAVLLAIFHILPTLVVDTALYSDIKGGGHPYITGLAIAGGIYCFGLEGAIIGPVLLCCIIVATNLYSATINSDQVLTTPTPATKDSVRKEAGHLRRSVSTNNCNL